MNELAVLDAADMTDMFSAAETGGAYAGTDTIAEHTAEHTEVLGRSYGDDNILDMMAALSCSAAWVNMTSRAFSEVEAEESGHMAACLMDGGSCWRLNGWPRLLHEGGGICHCYTPVADMKLYS